LKWESQYTRDLAKGDTFTLVLSFPETFRDLLRDEPESIEKALRDIGKAVQQVCGDIGSTLHIEKVYSCYRELALLIYSIAW
jgi:hypothetical protein